MERSTINKYNEYFKNNKVKAIDFVNKFPEDSSTFIKVYDVKYSIKDFKLRRVAYFDYIVESFDLLPCGGIIYIKEDN